MPARVWGRGSAPLRGLLVPLASPAAAASAVQRVIRRGDPRLALMGMAVTFHFGGGDHPDRAESRGVQAAALNLPQERVAVQPQFRRRLRDGQLSVVVPPARRDGWTTTLRHTLTPSGGRLPGDLWDEYRCECATRDRLHLPEMSLAEFRGMRDWTDQFEEQEDDDHGITESLDTPPYDYSGRR